VWAHLRSSPFWNPPASFPFDRSRSFPFEREPSPFGPSLSCPGQAGGMDVQNSHHHVRGVFHVGMAWRRVLSQTWRNARNKAWTKEEGRREGWTATMGGSTRELYTAQASETVQAVVSTHAGRSEDGAADAMDRLDELLPLSPDAWPDWAVLEPIRRTSTNKKKKKRTKRYQHHTQASFLSSLPHESLPSMSLLRTARTHAGCAPSLRGQALVADVLSVRDHVALLHADTQRTVHVPEHELTHAPTPWQGPSDGETAVVRVVGKQGDLDPRSCEEARRLASAWDVLKEAMRNRTKVKGRVLNAVNGGHAVGLAGYVAFLPSSRCRASTSARLGVLQDFLVLSMNHSTKNVVVAEPHAASSSMGPGGRRRFGRDDGGSAANRRRNAPAPRPRSDGRKRETMSAGEERGRYSKSAPDKNL